MAAPTPGGVGAAIARAIVTTAASQAVIVVLVFVTSVAQARLLGAVGRGELALFANATAIIVLAGGLGINSAITFFVASGAARPRALFRTLRPVYLLSVGGVLAISALVTASGLRRFLPESLADLWLVVALTSYFALAQAATWLSAVLAARGSFSAINATAVFVGGVGTFASVSLLVLAPDWASVSVIIALLIALEGARATLLGIHLLRRSKSPSRHGATVSAGSPAVRQLLRYSGLVFVVDSLQFLAYRSDMWILDAFRGTAALGVYALAVALAQLVWIVPGATGTVLFPYAAMPGTPGAELLALRAARIGLVVSAGCGVAGWIAAQLLVVSLFGPDFAEVPSLIGILLLGIVPFSVAKVMGNYLAGSNAIGLNAIATGVTLAVAIALALLLIPSFGATGAAWATVVAYTLQTLLLMTLFARRTALPIRAVLRLHAAPRED